MLENSHFCKISENKNHQKNFGVYSISIKAFETNFISVSDVSSIAHQSDSYPVKICVRILWHVIVEHNVDSLDIHATTKQVGGHQDTLVKVLELLIVC